MGNEGKDLIEVHTLSLDVALCDETYLVLDNISMLIALYFVHPL